MGIRSSCYNYYYNFYCYYYYFWGGWGGVVCVCVGVCVCAFVFVSVCVCMCMCLYIYICVMCYVCLCLCLCLCVYISIVSNFVVRSPGLHRGGLTTRASERDSSTSSFASTTSMARGVGCISTARHGATFAVAWRSQPGERYRSL